MRRGLRARFSIYYRHASHESKEKDYTRAGSGNTLFYRSQTAIYHSTPPSSDEKTLKPAPIYPAPKRPPRPIDAGFF